MIQAVRHVISPADVSLADSLGMDSLVPANVLGLGGEPGRILPTYRAGFTLLDDHTDMRNVVIDSRYFMRLAERVAGLHFLWRG